MRALIILGSVSVALAACGGSTSGGTTGGTTGGSSGGTTGGTGGAMTATVTIGDFSFSPANVNILPGGTITFVNSGQAPHTATSEAQAGNFTNAAAAGGFMFGGTTTISAGTSSTVTVPAGLAPGVVQPYFCNIHKAMMSPSDPTITIQ